MTRLLLISTLLSLTFSGASAQDADETPEASDAEKVVPKDEGPRTMSGMSILGNEEAPKSLVIVPWKSSEMGDEIGLADTLDDRARPVDKEVFLRELTYYQIRSGE
jgi:hypothetical protein